MLKKNCCFCEEIKYSISNESFEIFGDFFDRIIKLDYTKKLFVMPDINPIDIYHGLICTTSHYNSYYNARSMIKGKEILKVILGIENCYKDFNQIIYFEHGSKSFDSGGQCVCHAHIHFVPTNTDIYQDLMQYLNNKSGLNKISDFYSDDYMKIIEGYDPLFEGYLTIFIIKQSILKGSLFQSNNIPRKFLRNLYSQFNPKNSYFDLIDKKSIILETFNRIKENINR